MRFGFWKLLQSQKETKTTNVLLIVQHDIVTNILVDIVRNVSMDIFRNVAMDIVRNIPMDHFTKISIFTQIAF